MPGLIPRSFIDDLVARSDIVEVIDSYVRLRRAGKNYSACCPFHEERTPSFSVSPDKQFYYCFGCGATGNVLSFLMDYLRLDFVDAVQELADRQGLAVPHEDGGAAGSGVEDSRAPLYGILEQAAQFYRRQLQQHPQAKTARDYLQKRGLSREIIEEFGLGYAPPGWDHLLKALGNTAEQRALLDKAGLVVEKEQKNGFYDRFRERLMFPIHDQRGRVIAFGGRVLDDSKPKYLNSPETPVFHKGGELYGLHFVRKTRPAPRRVIVVEGYMDVLALMQAGLRNAVATLGTAVGGEHLTRLFRVVSEVAFCFDGDEAGHKAAWRGLEATLPQLGEGRQASFVFLPADEDPDSLIKTRGVAEFDDYLEQAAPLSEYLFRHLAESLNLATAEGRARLVELAQPLIQQVPAGAYRELLGQRLQELSGITTAPITKTAAKIHRPQAPAKPSLVRTAISLLLHRPEMAERVDQLDSLRVLREPGVELLIGLLEYLQQHPQTKINVLLEHWRESEHYAALNKLAGRDLMTPPEGIEAEFLGAVGQLEHQAVGQRLDELLNKSKIPGSLSEAERQEMGRLLLLQAKLKS
jgi:DNA primase